MFHAAGALPPRVNPDPRSRTFPTRSYHAMGGWSMQENRRTKAIAGLDRLRLAHGNEGFESVFRDLCIKDRAQAARLLNDDKLRFPTLFILRREIDEFGISGALSGYRRTACELARALASPDPGKPWQCKPEHVPALRWMLRTGAREEGLGKQYDAVMDRAAALLCREHRDRKCLPIVAEMAFARRRCGSYAGDAEWALFESGDPSCLKLVSARLASRNATDREQARRMLNFIPSAAESTDGPALQRRRVMRWLSRNLPHLKYTGLGSQQGPAPVRFELDTAAASRARGRKGAGK
jgi:hypothetical protein